MRRAVLEFVKCANAISSAIGVKEVVSSFSDQEFFKRGVGGIMNARHVGILHRRLGLGWRVDYNDRGLLKINQILYSGR